MATDFDWTGFRALSKRLDDLVGGTRDDEEFAQDVRRALAFVYTAGIAMPSAGDVFDAAGGEEFWNDTIDLDAELAEEGAAQMAVSDLAQRIAASVRVAQQDPDLDSEDLTDLAETAAQGLHDARVGLSAGARYFDEKRADEAAWDWAFGFDEWGSHALSALAALHELLWGAR